MFRLISQAALELTGRGEQLRMSIAMVEVPEVTVSGVSADENVRSRKPKGLDEASRSLLNSNVQFSRIDRPGK
jgi:hypothetical protein